MRRSFVIHWTPLALALIICCRLSTIVANDDDHYEAEYSFSFNSNDKEPEINYRFEDGTGVEVMQRNNATGGLERIFTPKLAAKLAAANGTEHQFREPMKMFGNHFHRPHHHDFHRYPSVADKDGFNTGVDRTFHDVLNRFQHRSMEAIRKRMMRMFK